MVLDLKMHSNALTNDDDRITMMSLHDHGSHCIRLWTLVWV